MNTVDLSQVGSVTKQCLDIVTSVLSQLWPVFAATFVQMLGYAGVNVSYDAVAEAVPRLFALVIIVLMCVMAFRVARGLIIFVLMVIVVALLLSVLERSGVFDMNSVTDFMPFAVSGNQVTSSVLLVCL